MPQMLEVGCKHLENELMRVRFARSQLVSDHPAEWGGTDTGPAPGEMILMALASATALAGRHFADRHKLAVSQISARANISSIQEGLPERLRHVSLPHLTYADRFWRLLELNGSLSESERDALVECMAENRIARTIRNGISLDERVVYRAPPYTITSSAAHEGRDHLLKGRTSLGAGEKRIASSASDWRVTAVAADERTCLVQAAGSLSVVGREIDDRRGPTPEELLLGGLAACTTIYVARNAMFHDIPLQSVHVRVRTELPEVPDEPIIKVEKVAELTGEFTEDQRKKLEQFAAYCAFGITLRRGTPIIDNALLSEAPVASAAVPTFDAFDRSAPTPDDPSFCSDGSCCVPIYSSQSA